MASSKAKSRPRPKQSLLEDMVRAVISAQLGVPYAKIATKADLTRDLDGDELDIIEVLFMIEEIFGVEMPQSAPSITTGKIAEILFKNWDKRRLL